MWGLLFLVEGLPGTTCEIMCEIACISRESCFLQVSDRGAIEPSPTLPEKGLKTSIFSFFSDLCGQPAAAVPQEENLWQLECTITHRNYRETRDRGTSFSDEVARLEVLLG